MIDSIRRDAFDWAILGIATVTALLCFVGALCTVPWTAAARSQATTQRFNFLWITRCSLQVVGVLYAISQLLPLRAIWSVQAGDSIDARLNCRLFLAANLGLLEPAFLLIALCACTVPLSGRADHTAAPNLPVLLLAAGWALPTCVIQVFAAFFTRVVDQLDYKQVRGHRFFEPYYTIPTQKCGHAKRSACQLCVYPEFSTLISFGFALVYLGCLVWITRRIAVAAINKVLARRARLLQLAICLPLTGSICARGTTVLFQPYQLGFDLLRLAAVISVCGLIVAVCFVMAWRPVLDAALARQCVAAFQELEEDKLPEHIPLVSLSQSRMADKPPVDFEAGAMDGSDQTR